MEPSYMTPSSWVHSCRNTGTKEGAGSELLGLHFCLPPYGDAARRAMPDVRAFILDLSASRNERKQVSISWGKFQSLLIPIVICHTGHGTTHIIVCLAAYSVLCWLLALIFCNFMVLGYVVFLFSIVSSQSWTIFLVQFDGSFRLTLSSCCAPTQTHITACLSSQESRLGRVGGRSSPANIAGEGPFWTDMSRFISPSGLNVMRRGSAHRFEGFPLVD